MRSRSLMIAACLALGTFAGSALADGTEMPGQSAPPAAPMPSLHAMMTGFSPASGQLQLALENNDAPGAEAAGGKILAVIPYLKKATPYRNANQREKFLELAENLDQALLATTAQARKGEFAAARTAFTKVEAACTACHLRFR
jgi:hypothetical protein